MTENSAQPHISRGMYIAVMTAVVFSVMFTFSACGIGKDKEWKTFSNCERMKTYLSMNPYNTPDTPFKIKLNINDNDLTDFSYSLVVIEHYYFLDLSGSTITTVPAHIFATFSNERRLTGIILPNTVTAIEKEAFRGCKTLVSITIPNSVTIIREKAFADCAGLINITIPDSVTTIEEEAFKGCENLVSVKISNKVPYIRNSVFYECRNLTDITIPDKVWGIGDFAFSRCGSLVNITIPNNVTEIGRGAFKYCFSLTGVTIPDSVTEIGLEAFYNCYNLVSVTFEGTMKRELKYYADDEEKAYYRKLKYYADDDEENVNYRKIEYYDDDENENDNFYYKSVFDGAFIGNLHEKFYEKDAEYGTPGTYAAVEASTPTYRATGWIRQP